MHPETYKYFLERDEVVATWGRLVERYGEARRNAGFRTMEVAGPRFILRSTLLGNPITVLRRRDCTPADILELHALLGYDE
ncbi:MAG: hypothetical protein JNK56_13745 [Myxococcales bacterium]|nr:hypothetical protein [Myxococcales bacterium]